jgi:aspartate-semialdehyde dehydrogenase
MILKNLYRCPLSQNRDEVFVGCIRRDETQPKTLNCGRFDTCARAYTNAVQIAEYMVQNQLI